MRMHIAARRVSYLALLLAWIGFTTGLLAQGPINPKTTVTGSIVNFGGGAPDPASITFDAFDQANPASSVTLGDPNTDVSTFNGRTVYSFIAEDVIPTWGAGDVIVLHMNNADNGQSARLEIAWQDSSFIIRDVELAPAGTATGLIFLDQPPTSVLNAQFVIRVAVRDALGDIVTDSDASISVALFSNPSAATLSGTTTQLATNGVATFTLSVDEVGTAYTLMATSTGLGQTISQPFNITSAATGLLITQQPPATHAAGSVFVSVPQVTLRDDFGNIVPDGTIAVTASITPGTGAADGVLLGTKTLSSSTGIITFQDLKINQLGEGYTLTLSAPGLPAVATNAFDIVAGAPVAVKFLVTPGAGAANGLLAPAPVVAIVDVAGNTVPDAAFGVVMAENLGPGALLGSTSMTTSGGTATFSNLRIDQPGAHRLLATAFIGTATVTAESPTFTIGDAPVLTISKQHDITTNAGAPPGGNVTFTIFYGNGGLRPASNITIREVLPAELKFVSVQGGGFYDAATETITWYVGQIPAQNAVYGSFTFVAAVPDAAAMPDGGIVVNSDLTINGTDSTGAPLPAGNQTTALQIPVADTTPPRVRLVLPAEEYLNGQVPVLPVIQLGVMDANLNPAAVTITIDGDVVYTGDVDEYDTSTQTAQDVRGLAKRGAESGNEVVYTFTPTVPFDFGATVTIVVSAADEELQQTPAEDGTFTFTTVSTDLMGNELVYANSNQPAGSPDIGVDGNGDVWAVWVAPRTGTEYPGYNTLYLARRGEYGWGAATEVGAPVNHDRNAPSIGISGNTIWIACEEDMETVGAGRGWDIWVYKSEVDEDGNLADWNRWVINGAQTLSYTGDQTHPSLVADSTWRCYVAWQSKTDAASASEIHVSRVFRGVVRNEVVLPKVNTTSNATEPCMVQGYEWWQFEYYVKGLDGDLGPFTDWYREECLWVVWVEDQGNGGTSSLYGIRQNYTRLSNGLPATVDLSEGKYFPMSTGLQRYACEIWADPNEIFNEALTVSHPVLRGEPGNDVPTVVGEGTKAHLVWVNESDVYADAHEIWYGKTDYTLPRYLDPDPNWPPQPISYAQSINNLSGTPAANVTLDDRAPTLAVTGSTEHSNVVLYTAWEQQQTTTLPESEGGGTEVENHVYLSQLSGDGAWTVPIRVNNDTGNTRSPRHYNPTMILEPDASLPALAWEDNRIAGTEADTDIWSASSRPRLFPLGSAKVADHTATTAQVLEFPSAAEALDPTADDPYALRGYRVTVTIPVGALTSTVDMQISRIGNPPTLGSGVVQPVFNLSPPGLTFNAPVTIRWEIPAADYTYYSNSPIYYYNVQTGTWSLEGITNVTRDISGDPVVITFQTTHFSYFGFGGSTLELANCSLSADSPVTTGGSGALLTLTLRNTLSEPMPFMLPGEIQLLADAGETGLTLINPVAPTDANGQTTGWAVSTEAEQKRVRYTVNQATPIGVDPPVVDPADMPEVSIRFTAPKTFDLMQIYSLISLPVTDSGVVNTTDFINTVGNIDAVYIWDARTQRWSAFQSGQEVRYPIVAVDLETNSVTVAGDVVGALAVGSSGRIGGSSANNGAYTIASAAVGADAVTKATITVIGLTETLDSAAVDGAFYAPRALPPGTPVLVSATSNDDYTWTGAWAKNYNFTLYPGFNLLSLPITMEAIVRASILVRQIPNCTAVYSWDPAASRWKTFINGAGGEDFTVSPGDAFMAAISAGGSWPQ